MTHPATITVGDPIHRYHVSVCGHDVALELDSRLYDPANKRILGPRDYFAPGARSELRVHFAYGTSRRAFADEDLLRVTHYRAKAGSHIIRQLVCCLAAYHSREFDIVHGAGLLADSRKNLGLLLVGGPHSGKSTLSAALGNIIMDDDIMLIRREEMQVAGSMGFVSYRDPENGRKYLTPLPNGVKQAHIDLVFLLDKKLEGGSSMDVDNSIPRHFARLEDLPVLLRKAYLRMAPIRVQAPIYRLGTRGKLRETLHAAREIIEQHI